MPCQDICQTFQTYHFIRHYWLLSWSHFQPIFPLATIWLCMGTSRLICLSNTYCKQLHLFFNPSISSWLITHPFKNRKCTSSKSRITTILFSERKKSWCSEVLLRRATTPANIELDLMHPFLIIFLATWEEAKVQGESLFCSIQGVFNHFQEIWLVFMQNLVRYPVECYKNCEIIAFDTWKLYINEIYCK